MIRQSKVNVSNIAYKAVELDNLSHLTDTSPWRSRFDTIYREIRRRIVLLEYPPDTKLDIKSISVEFEISRTPIRSVTQRLEREGLVITKHGVGTMVTGIIPSQSRDAIQLRLHLATLIGDADPKPIEKLSLESLELLNNRIKKHVISCCPWFC